MASEDINFFATSIIGLISAFSLYKVCTNQSKASEKKKILKTLNQTPIKIPDDKFVNGERVIVKGTVQPYQSLTNQSQKIMRFNPSNKKMDQYVLYMKFKEAMYSNENFSNVEQYVISFRQILGKADITFNQNFLLSNGNKNIKVTSYDQTDYSKALEIIRWNNKKRRLTFTQKIQVLMLSYFRAVGTLVIADKGRPRYLRGIDVGTREVQAGIKVGSSILALGTISLSLDGQISLTPNMLFNNRIAVVQNLQQILQGHESSRNFWFVVLLLGSLYVGRRMYNYNKKHNLVDKIKNWWNQQRITTA